jgi:hypothetical protein
MYFLPVTNSRTIAASQFDALRRQTFVSTILAWITGQNFGLEDFDDQHQCSLPSPRYLGLQDVPVGSITGSVGRTRDFDHHFRPRYKHLRDRWVNIYLRYEVGDWPSIQLNKVGNNYYVIDGHHRVSVANYSGVKYISAEVWEYPAPCIHLCDCQDKSSTLKRAFRKTSFAHS